ncbi:MAG: DUF6398 domain-containing protein [Planctomycetales bacterium]
MSPSIQEEPAVEVPEVVPEEFRAVHADLVRLTDRFCRERLNEEYADACRALAVAVCIPGSPVARGKRNGWAAAIAYSAGWVNFLGDAGFEPFLRGDDIAKGFGISPATMHKNAREIREGLELIQFDPRFTLPSLMDSNPLLWLVEVDGLIVDARSASREIQEAAYVQGAIPFLPGEGPSQANEGETESASSPAPILQRTTTAKPRSPNFDR